MLVLEDNGAETTFEEFLQEFDRDWLEKVFKRFERDSLSGAPREVLMQRYALTAQQFTELLRLIEIRLEQNLVR